MNVYRQVERMCLSRVMRPARYTAAVLNYARPARGEVDLRVALVFPDAYEIGMSHLGLRILYHILAGRPRTTVDLCFAPWVDLEGELRRRRLPLWGLFTRAPLGSFHLVGFSLQHELQYTNMLTILDLAGVPLGARDRGEDDPLVIAGGPCVANPEPVAEFLDAAVLGDGEEVILEVADRVAEGYRRREPRREILEGLAELGGVYVPSLFVPSSHAAHPPQPASPGVPAAVSRRVVWELKEEYYPLRPLVSLSEITHDRLSLEVMRGCSRGCRFCQAGCISRPVRHRPVESVVRLAVEGIDAGGWEELSLVSLSTSDYAYLTPLIEELDGRLGPRQVAISLPSLRPDGVSPRLLEAVTRVRRTGLTLAPEAGSERLRRVINKPVSDAEFLASIESAARAGWRAVKLYFMLGLPEEEDSDLSALAGVVREAERAARRPEGGRMGLTVSISPFVPKPHTPFQWERQRDEEELRRKIAFLRGRVQSPRVRVRWRDPRMSFLEGLMARGDRALGKVIREAWRKGARFDSWTDTFNLDRWLQALRSQEVSPMQYLAERRVEDPLPWDHVRMGVSPEFLRRERERAKEAESWTDCRIQGCYQCGLGELGERAPAICPLGGDETHVGAPREPISGEDTKERVSPRALQRSRRPAVGSLRIRLRYTVGGDLRFLSHLDMVRLLDRLVRRCRLPVAYSQGHSPRARISFGPPRAVSMGSEAEYVDLSLNGPYSEEDARLLREALPEGMSLERSMPLYGRRPSLEKSINCGAYEVEIASDGAVTPALAGMPEEGRLGAGELPAVLEERAAAFESAAEVRTRRVTPKKAQEVDLRGTLLSRAWGRGPEGSLSLLLLLRLGGRGLARPVEVASAILGVAEDRSPLLRIVRTGLFYRRGNGEIVDPFDEVHTSPWPARLSLFTRNQRSGQCSPRY